MAIFSRAQKRSAFFFILSPGKSIDVVRLPQIVGKLATVATASAAATANSEEADTTLYLSNRCSKAQTNSQTPFIMDPKSLASYATYLLVHMSVLSAHICAALFAILC